MNMRSLHRKLASPSDDDPKKRLIEEEFKVGKCKY